MVKKKHKKASKNILDAVHNFTEHLHLSIFTEHKQVTVKLE